MKDIKLKIKRLTDTAILPKMAHDGDACLDIYADLPELREGESIRILPHHTVKINTGFATEIPYGYWAPVFARSGMATKHSLRPIQGVPVMDSNYRGEWIIPIHNDSTEIQYIYNHDRIAQFTLLETPNIILEEVDELSDSNRGEKGFGSSGGYGDKK